MLEMCNIMHHSHATGMLSGGGPRDTDMDTSDGNKLFDCIVWALGWCSTNCMSVAFCATLANTLLELLIPHTPHVTCYKVAVV